MASPKAKKRFGQHFITDLNLCHKIAESLLYPGVSYHHLVEVGPGKGMLTKALITTHRPSISLYAVEVDEYWHQFLLRTFPELKEGIIQKSILKIAFNSLLNGDQFGLVGNFPYNISSQILLKTLANRHYVPELLGMFQLEVAQRLIATPGNRSYGLLSIMFQTYYEGRICFRLSPGAFSPPPKVNSAVLRGIRRETNEYEVPFDWLLALVKKAFQQRRKKLINNLKPYREMIMAEDAGLLDKRPEDVSPSVYQRLALKIGKAEGW